MKAKKISKLWVVASLFLTVFTIGCGDHHHHPGIDKRAVVEDACNHMVNGPDSTRNSGGELHGELPHKRWVLNLDTTSNPYTGTFKVHAEEGGDHSHKVGALTGTTGGETKEFGIFLNKSATIAITQGTNTVSAKDDTLDISTCVDIKAYKVYELKYETEYSFKISGSAQKAIHVVFQNFADSHAH